MGHGYHTLKGNILFYDLKCIIKCKELTCLGTLNGHYATHGDSSIFGFKLF